MRVNQLRAGVLLTYLNIVISTLIPLLYTPIMLRILGQAEYGLYSLANSVISYLSLLTLGMGSAIQRYLVRCTAAGDKQMLQRTLGLFTALYAIAAAVCVAVGAVLTLGTSKLFGVGLTDPEIRKMNVLLIILSVSMGTSFLFVSYASVVVCYERYVFRKGLDLILTLAGPVLNLVALYAGYGSVGMAVTSLLMQYASLAMYIWYTRKKLDIRPQFRNLPVDLLKDLFGFLAFVLVGMIADMLYWATDKVLIGAMMGSVAVAVYNVGGTFQGVLQSLSSAISSVFAPRVNHLVFSGQPISENSTLLIRVGRIQYLIVSLVLSGFVVFGRPFITLWAGEEYLQAYPVALLTMIPLAVPLIQNTAFITITALSKHQFRAVLYAVLAVANVVSTRLLIPTMGIVGAALCTCVVFVLGHGIIMNWFYYKRIGLDIPGFWKNIFKMTIVPGSMAAICLAVGLNIENVWQLLGSIAAYTGVFCILSWLISMNRYEKDLVMGMMGKLLPRKKQI